MSQATVSPYLTLVPRTEAEARVTRALPAGRTFDEALARAKEYKNRIWGSSGYSSEDARIDDLQRLCTALCSDDRTAGRELATSAVWAS